MCNKKEKERGRERVRERREKIKFYCKISIWFKALIDFNVILLVYNNETDNNFFLCCVANDLVNEKYITFYSTHDFNSSLPHRRPSASVELTLRLISHPTLFLGFWN